MPVSVPTAEEGALALDALQAQLDIQQQAIGELERRVTELEELVTSGTPPDTEQPPDPGDMTPPPGTLRVLITIAGEDYAFDEADGVDLGAYVDPDGRFAERCTRVTHEGTPLRVDIRRMDGRLSVIFGQGYWSDTSHANLPEYDVTIEGSELDEPVSLHCPHQAAYQRWRWCSAPWPMPMRNLEDLYQQKLLPRFDPTLTRGTETYYGPQRYTPMSLAGLEPYMPQTGGRGDIGHITEWQGYYVCHEDDDSALQDVLAQGEAAGTFPWDFCDPDTNAVIDPLEQYPQSTLYAEYAGSPFITYSTSQNFAGATISGPPGTVLSPNGSPPDWNFVLDANRVQCRIPVDTKIGDDGTIALNCEVLGASVQTGLAQVVYWTNEPVAGCEAMLDTFLPGSGVTIDSAHQPACSYLPFLLTGDPYYLENLQRQVSFIIMENASAPVRSYGVIQPRATGWSARTLAACAKVSPEDPPSWLLPRRLYTKAIEDWADKFYPETVGNTTEVRTVINSVVTAYMHHDDGSETAIQHYQEDICLGGLSWLALLHPDTRWPEIVSWHVEHAMARLDPESGWSLAAPSIYYQKVGTEPYPATYDDWRAAWAGNEAYAGVGYSCEVPTMPAGQADYWTHMSSGMAIAWQAGAVKCEPHLARLLTAIAAGLAPGAGNAMTANRCVAGPVS